MSDSPYDGFIADFYDTSPIVAGRTHDIAFYRGAAREFGDPVLELGCGTGRVTMAIAQDGKRVTGLDVSEKMLQRGADRRARLSAEARERVHLVQGDMRSFDLGEKFRLIIVPFRPFQHLLETNDHLDCLACVRKHLAPNGRLIVDFFQTDPRRMHDVAYLNEHEVAVYKIPGGRRVRLTERVVAFHRSEQRNDVEMIYTVTEPDGKTERHVMAWTLRYFFRYEVEHLLARSGLRVAALYGNFDKSPLRDDSAEMIFVAEAS
jgi:SAM-dependent methyltransferase